MGNKLGRRRRVVDEKYTRPQGLYNHKDIDQKKLRKLILKSKLAPCYPGEEECTHDLEECPICFLFYPSLNRSRCCMKSICTECFLQMKVPNSTRPTQCPFCKMENYAVEYRGRKTKEEKGLEQMEEQRVIEAKIRIRQQELQDEEERMHKRKENCSSGGNVAPADVEDSSNAATTASVSVVEGEKIISSQDSFATPIIRPPPAPWTNGDSEFLFDLDLEEIMVMEATWLSIQESGRLWNISYPDSPSRQYIPDDRTVPSPVGLQCGSSSSPSGYLAFAIAALAERQQMAEESSMNSTNGNISSINTLQGANLSTDNINEVPPDGTLAMTWSHGECDVDHGPGTAESATHYADSAAADDGGNLLSLLKPDDSEGSLDTATDPVIPESFEEQMMLATAISLAEAGSASSG